MSRSPHFLKLAAIWLGCTSTFVFAVFGCTNPSPPDGTTITRLEDSGMVISLDEPIGPIGKEHGIPVGWRHDREGGEAAATAFVEATRTVGTALPLARRDMIMSLATPSYGPDLVDSTNLRLDEMYFSLGQHGVGLSDLVWSEYALTVDSTVVSNDEMVVRVWSVLVLAVRNTPVPHQSWRTSTITLDWVDGDWKVDGWTSEAGPLPAPPTEADVASTNAVIAVTSWRPAPSVGGS